MVSRGTVIVRVYEELNDFLPEARRKRDIDVEVDRPRSVRDALESLGVPHTEIDLILVDGKSVDFAHLLQGGERVAVPDVRGARHHARAASASHAARDPRFIADVPGELARHLRMAGFDTSWSGDWDDDEIVRRSLAERRTILTRDKAILRRSEVERGYFVRAVESEAQLAEVVRALQLERLVALNRRAGATPSGA
jgi:hypothetical protein